MNNTKHGTQPIVLQVTVGAIGLTTIIANAALVFVLFRQRHMLKKPYNLVILNLAAVDILTGILLFITPDLVISHTLYPSAMKSTRAFCYLLQSSYVIVTLAKLSIALVTFLAFSRWLSVVYPFRYRMSFSRKHAVVYLAVMWVVLFVVSLNSPFTMKYKSHHCRRKEASISHAVWTTFYVFVTFLLPAMLSWLMFAHIYLHLKRAQNAQSVRSAVEKKSKSLVRMCAVTALVMTISWAPAEIYLLIAVSGAVDFSTRITRNVHDITKCLGFFNSCVNPFIYCLTNQSYRREFEKVFKSVLCHKKVEPDDSQELDCL